jgi:hypothetical protein
MDWVLLGRVGVGLQFLASLLFAMNIWKDEIDRHVGKWKSKNGRELFSTQYQEYKATLGRMLKPITRFPKCSVLGVVLSIIIVVTYGWLYLELRKDSVTRHNNDKKYDYDLFRPTAPQYIKIAKNYACKDRFSPSWDGLIGILEQHNDLHYKEQLINIGIAALHYDSELKILEKEFMQAYEIDNTHGLRFSYLFLGIGSIPLVLAVGLPLSLLVAIFFYQYILFDNGHMPVYCGQAEFEYK